MSGSGAAAVGGRPAGGSDGGSGADIDGEEWGPWPGYVPGGIELATDAVLYTELAVVDPAGEVLCQAIPVFERTNGLLIAVPEGSSTACRVHRTLAESQLPTTGTPL